MTFKWLLMAKNTVGFHFQNISVKEEVSLKSEIKTMMLCAVVTLTD